MVSEQANITASNSPQERFKKMVEDVLTDALWDFGLRQNEFEIIPGKGIGLLGLGRKPRKLKQTRYTCDASYDFLGHHKTLFREDRQITLLTKADKTLIDNDTAFLIVNDTIQGFEEPQKMAALIQSLLKVCKKRVKQLQDDSHSFDIAKYPSFIIKTISPAERAQVKLCRKYSERARVSHTNAHLVESFPENAYDIIEKHLKDAVRKYFGIEYQDSHELSEPVAKFTASIDKDSAKDQFKTEKKRLEGAKSHQFQKLVIYGMAAAEDFRGAAQEIGEWQSKRIAELPPSIKHSMRMCDMMRDYKSLEPGERVQIAAQMVREIGSLQKSIKIDINTISADCETTEEATEILAEHRQNIQRYAGSLKSEEETLSYLFGSAAVHEKTFELAEIIAHTGIQVAQQTAVHQSYNIATLQQISRLSGKMDQLAGSVSRLSIAIKLRDMISTGGIVGDLAKDTLENTNLFQKDIAEFTSMNIDDLDDIIQEQAIHIKSKIDPIAAEAQVIEQKMIEGEPIGQVLLPHYEIPDEQNIAAE